MEYRATSSHGEKHAKDMEGCGERGPQPGLEAGRKGLLVQVNPERDLEKWEKTGQAKSVSRRSRCVYKTCK